VIAAAEVNLLIGWAALAAGLSLSFLYSGLETGTYAVNKIRLDLRAEAGVRPARRLHRMLIDPGKPLVVVLIGNNLGNYLASAGVVLVLTAQGSRRPDWAAAAVLTPLVFVFCELLPKNLFHRHGERLTYFFSGFLEASRRVFTACGVVGLVGLLVRLILWLAGRRLGDRESPLGPGGGRIASLLAEGRASGAITDTQSIIAQRVVELDRVRVGDVMVALDQAVLMERSAGVEEVRRLLATHGHPRFGVYEGERSNIVGVLSAYDVLLDEGGAPPAGHVRPVVPLPRRAGVIEALVTLQRRHSPIGFVFDDDGRCVGVATIKDLVEEIVGELAEW